MASETISHYQLIHKLGSGGMGEVYLAEDKQLDRRVAIKFLPPESTADEQAKRRLIREARTAGKLDHPNICSIYEVSEEDGRSFIVMQYIEGETLARLIQRKPLDLRESLDIAVHVADALAEAHALQVIHRDIKPQNIMITARGQVKVLDFGLATVAREKLSTDSAAQTESLLTQPGTIIGTVPYMSPEQARGEPLDARSDIFSLGVVLYEMVTGRSPFACESIAASFSAILTLEPPPLALYSKEAPAELQRVVTRALRKDREERYQTARDLLVDLKSLKRNLESGAEQAYVAPPVASENATTMSLPAAVEIKTVPIVPAVTSAEYIVSAVTRHKKAAILSVAMLAIIAAAAIFFYSQRAAALTERDTILLADFDNKTGEEVFDGALKQALAVQLEQSPFLNIFPEQQIRETLRYMGRSPDERVTKDVAREICERQGIKALLAGSISSLGSHYIIGLEITNTLTGEVIARQQAEPESREQVLRTLGEAATRLREKLGESLGSIQKFDAPIEETTTSSLEALKAFSLGHELRLRSPTEAILFLKRAVELDPDFATAYSALAVIHRNGGQPELAAEYAQKAFERRDRASEIERFHISLSYYRDVTKELNKQIEVLEVLKGAYPRDRDAHNSLAVRYNMIGKYEKANEEARASVSLYPNNAAAHANVAIAYMGLNRFDEARQTLEQAVAQGIDGGNFFRAFLHLIAFVQTDPAAMKRQIEGIKGTPQEYIAEGWEAGAAAFSGQSRKAREFSDRAVNLAARHELKEIAARYEAINAAREALFGHCKQAREGTTKALALARTNDSLRIGAVALALCGEFSQAQAITNELVKRYPTDTLLNAVWLPITQALIEINRGSPARAVQQLQAASEYEMGMEANLWPAYIRGLAYLSQESGPQAAAEFQKLLDHQVVTLNWFPIHSLAYPLYPLAHLGLARAAAAMGDTTKSRKAYEDFFGLWKDADPDVPILIEARQEYEKLK